MIIPSPMSVDLPSDFDAPPSPHKNWRAYFRALEAEKWGKFEPELKDLVSSLPKLSKTRAMNCFNNENIYTIDDLKKRFAVDELRHIPNLGKKTIDAIKQRLPKLGSRKTLESENAQLRTMLSKICRLANKVLEEFPE